jgi:hypothetical protein
MRTLVLAFGAVVVLCVGCGSSSKSDLSTGAKLPPALTTRFTGAPNLYRNVVTAEPKSEAELKPPNCTRGRVVVGREPGQINFRVSCFGAPGRGAVRVEIDRHPFVETEGVGTIPGIRRVTEHPRLSGGGETSKARCAAQPGWIAVCKLSVPRKVVMSGAVWVRPQGRCLRSVDLVLHEAPSGRVCPDFEERCPQSRPRTLASGLPKGC